MGGDIGEWSNTAPRAEPCFRTTYVVPYIYKGTQDPPLDENTLKPAPASFGGHLPGGVPPQSPKRFFGSSLVWPSLAPPGPPLGPPGRPLAALAALAPPTLPAPFPGSCSGPPALAPPFWPPPPGPPGLCAPVPPPPALPRLRPLSAQKSLVSSRFESFSWWELRATALNRRARHTFVNFLQVTWLSQFFEQARKSEKAREIQRMRGRARERLVEEEIRSATHSSIFSK